MNEEAARAEEATFVPHRRTNRVAQPENPCTKQSSSLRSSPLAFLNIANAQEVIEIRKQWVSVSRILGDVRIQNRGKAERPATVGDVLCEGDELFAGYSSEAIVVDSDKTILTVRSNTQIRIATIDERQFNIRLEAGEVRAQVKVTGPTRPDVRIQTPTATASVRGTDFTVKVDKKGTTEVSVTEGTVALVREGTQKEIAISAGETAIADAAAVTFLSSSSNTGDFSDTSSVTTKLSRLSGNMGVGLLLIAFAAFSIWFRLRQGRRNLK